MIRFRIYFDKDKETEWLNSMAAQGQAMTGFFAGFYRFEPCEPGAWQYQVDIGQGFFHVKEDYAAFMREAGAEIVQTWGPWVILRRAGDEGDFLLYTDVESSISHYKRVLLLFKLVTILEMLGVLIEVVSGIQGSMWGWAGALLLGALVCVFINITTRTKRTINELEERQGIHPDSREPRMASRWLILGMALNSLYLGLQDRLPAAPRRVLGICAIIMMLAGLVRTVRSRKSDGPR